MQLDEHVFQKYKASFHESGYLWMEQPLGSADIDARQFGISFFSKEKVLEAIESNFQLIAYERGGIGNWQDLIIVRKKTGQIFEPN